jgi:hypothetical protein
MAGLVASLIASLSEPATSSSAQAPLPPPNKPEHVQAPATSSEASKPGGFLSNLLGQDEVYRVFAATLAKARPDPDLTKFPPGGSNLRVDRGQADDALKGSGMPGGVITNPPLWQGGGGGGFGIQLLCEGQVLVTTGGGGGRGFSVGKSVVNQSGQVRFKGGMGAGAGLQVFAVQDDNPQEWSGWGAGGETQSSIFDLAPGPLKKVVVASRVSLSLLF